MRDLGKVRRNLNGKLEYTGGIEEDAFGERLKQLSRAVIARRVARVS